MRTSRSRGAHRCGPNGGSRRWPSRSSSFVVNGSRGRSAALSHLRAPRRAAPRRTGSTPRGRRAARGARSLARRQLPGGGERERRLARCGRTPRSPRAGRPPACPPPSCARPAARRRRRSSRSAAAAPSRRRRAAARSGWRCPCRRPPPPPRARARSGGRRTGSAGSTRGTAGPPRSPGRPRPARTPRAPRRAWSASVVGVEVALVEQHLGAAGDRGHDARLARRAADRADAPRAEADLADRERRLGGRHEGVAPQRHRGGAGVRGLAGEHREVALDPERAEHRGRGLAPTPSTGPCSMCSSMYARAPRSREPDSLARSSSTS